MSSLWSILRGGLSTSAEEERYGLSQYAQEYVQFGGSKYPLYNYAAGPYRNYERIDEDFLGYVRGIYKADGVVFACMLVRQMVFSEVRFAWQKLEEGRPADIKVDDRLKLLERPWPNGGTGELLSRAIQDVDLSGNHYVVNEGNRLRRLRPDWVDIVLSAPPDTAVESDVVAYKYTPGGPESKVKPRFYLPDQIAHWAPIPDPEAQYRGMSWLSPVLTEILSDKAATQHKNKFFQNAATPNISVSLKETVTREQFEEFMEAMDRQHQGVHNAYKTLYLGGGADVRVIGSNMKDLDFKSVQGAGETRIAAAARVHPVVVGLSEGMQGSSLNAGNFRSAKDAFADGTMRPLWRGVCQAYSVLVKGPPRSRLWYDDRDIPFLRADQTERAQVQQREAAVIRQLVDGGFKPESVIEATRSHDWTQLEHTGLVSVQLLPPGLTAAPPTGTPGQGAPANPADAVGAKQPGRRPGGKSQKQSSDVSVQVNTPKAGGDVNV